MCAVITTFNSPHHSGAMPDLASSWASAGSAIWVYSSPVKTGFKTVAIARNCWPESWARGARPTARRQNPAQELITLGGATVILATSTSGNAFAAVLAATARRSSFWLFRRVS